MKESRFPMSKKDVEQASRDAVVADALGDPKALLEHDVPNGVDRRSFLIRAAVGGAAAVLTGCAPSPEEKTAKAAATAAPAAAAPSTPPRAADLNVVQKEKGP